MRYMLSSSSKYAVNAVFIWQCIPMRTKKIRAKEIAEAINLPSPFLAKLLQSFRGKNYFFLKRSHAVDFYLTPEAQQFPLLK